MAHLQPTGGSRLHKVIKAMRREKITFAKIFITVLLLASFPVTIILTNSVRNSGDIRSKATTPNLSAGKIIFAPFSFSKDQDDDAFLEFSGQAQIRNGFVSASPATNQSQFTAIVMDATGRQISSPQKFSLPQFVAIDTLDSQTRTGKAEFKKVSANSQGLTLPFVENASFVKIINPKGEIVKIISIQNATSTDNIINIKEIRGDDINSSRSLIDPLFNNQALAANGTFNIAIIGDNYNGDNLRFQSDVNDIASGLVSVEPFKTYKSNIVFYTQLSAIPICTYSTSLSCDDTQALQQASGLPYDKVYVLYNGPFAGYAYVGATLAYGTNATGLSVTVKQGLFIHELAGHVLGGLMDEYSYGATGVSYAPNCSDSSSCPSWSTISGLGCFSSCGYTNLYRATNNSSVMNTAFLNGSTAFDAFSSQIVAGKLTPYFNPIPSTPTIPPPIPTPTVIPEATVTIVPTITLADHPTSSLLAPRDPGSAGEPIISITPSITVVPAPSDTPIPSPTQPLTCNFPNFCTKGKYCASENALNINCTGSQLICCKGQTTTENITPTITQRFDLLPTIPLIPQDRITDSPAPTAIPVKPLSDNNSPPPPSATPQPTNPQSASQPSIPVQTVSISPTVFVNQNQSNNPPFINSPLTPAIETNYPSYPTPTQYEPENIVFERATPTPKPVIGVLDILAAPSRFVNNIVKSFFSLFSGK